MIAEAGETAIVLEKGLPGRDKACGDAFLPSAVECLHRFGFNDDRLRALRGKPFNQVDLFGTTERLWTVTYSDRRGWLLRRGLIDQAMREALGVNATVHYNTRAIGIGSADRNLSVSASTSGNGARKLECDAVIVASGSGSVLSSRLGLNGRPLMGASISGYARLSSDHVPRFVFGKPYQPGYAWAFPMENGLANVGVCLLKEKAEGIKDLGQRFLQDEVCKDLPRWRGGLGALWSGAGRTWHHHAGIVSCGDAAGLIDPLTGDGLTAAMTTGEQAGMAILDFLQNKGFTNALLNYTSKIRADFTEKYAVNSTRSVWRNLCGSKG